MERSLTIKSLLVGGLLLILQQSGVDIDGTQVDNFVLVATQILALITAWYGRVRKGDITLTGKRK